MLEWHQVGGSKLITEVYMLWIRNIVFSLLYLESFVVYNSLCGFYSFLQNIKFRSIDPSVMWVYHQIGHWSSCECITGDCDGVLWDLMESCECTTGDAVGVLWVYQQRCRWSPVTVLHEILMESCECTTGDAAGTVIHTLRPSFWCPRKEF